MRISQGSTPRRLYAIVPWLLVLALAQAPATHTVQKGDTLYSIAKRYGTTVEALLKLNGMSSPSIAIGQVLRLSTGVEAAPPPSNPPVPTAASTHTVQKGDTLYSIARRYGVTLEAVMRENKLEDNNLGVGQVLRIPQGQPQPAQPVNNPTPANPVPNPTLTPLPNPTLPDPTPPQPSPEPVQPPSTLPGDTDYDPANPLVSVVLKYLGLPYVFGSNSDRAVDCSAFVQQVYSELGIKVPRTSREQWAAFSSVQGVMKQGDLVFFSFGGKQIDHVGIYLGRGVFAHANSYGSRVVIESLDSPYYKKVYRGAKRVEALAQLQ